MLPRRALFTGYHHPSFLVFVGTAYAPDDGFFFVFLFFFALGFGRVRFYGFGFILLLTFRRGSFFFLEVFPMLAFGGSS
jgi:hypothetical protein